jgi:hypothetical protein
MIGLDLWHCDTSIGLFGQPSFGHGSLTLAARSLQT